MIPLPFVERKFMVVGTVFVSALVVSGTISGKIISLGGLTFSASAIAYSMTFPCTDIVGEIWGPRRAKTLVWLGFLAAFLGALLTTAAVALPAASFDAVNDEAFRRTLGRVPRIVGAGLAAYVVSQQHDVWLFHKLRVLTRGKWMFIRNNVSTAISQLIDSLTFVTLAFVGTISMRQLVGVMLGEWVVKLIIAGVDTPVVYLAVAWIRKGEESNTATT